MRVVLYVVVLAALLSGSVRAEQEPAGEPLLPEGFVGSWEVDLYFAADQPPSKTTMEIRSVSDGVVEGTFYGSAFDVARAGRQDGEVMLVASTEDGSGPYWHSGRMRVADEIEGQTLSVGREFLMAWRARRVPAHPEP